MPRLLSVMVLAVLVVRPGVAQDQPAMDSVAHAYRVFTGTGQAASLDDIVAAMREVDVVFVGEQHDDPVAHYLQREVLERGYQAYGEPASNPRPVALSLEMFERDVQPILDEYLAGLISEPHFLRSSRPWDNYATDYRPLVEFAKAHGLPVIAANAPRRYVNRVTRLGPASLNALPPSAKAWLPPLPYPGPTPAYEAKWNQLMADMMGGMLSKEEEADAAPSPAGEDQEAPEEASQPMHDMGHALASQALWDAAMAQAIARHLYARPGALVLHMVGGFHAEEGLGTPAQVGVYRPGTRALVIMVKPVADFELFDADAHTGLGDFVVLSDENLPRTFGGTQ